ncbi:methyl-accepting chemotaxis protein [Deferrisoma sp.]
MSLKAKLSLVISVLVIVPMLGGGFTAYWIAKHHALTQMRAEVDNLARTAVGLCESYYRMTGATEPSPELRQAILSIRVGKTGYPFALRSDGTTVLHPKLEGKNLKGVKDAKGKPFMDEMLGMKDGWVEYWWQNPGEPAPRKKISRVLYFEPWDWVFGVGSYEEEFLDGPKAIRNATVAASAVAIAVAVGVGFLFARGVGQAAGQLSRAFGQLAEGDLTADISVRRSDELGRMAGAYREMRRGLSELIRRVSDSAGTVASAAQQISASSQQVAAGADEQSRKATEVATAIEEVSSTVLEVSKNAQEVAQNAQEMSDVARQGEGVLLDSLERMDGIARMVEGLAARIEELGQKTESIGQVIRTIDEIADQTNLLALNAAIEAARAGEHGRGFAVVADEVRKLAEKTTKATKEVEATIRSIQEESRQAVEATSVGRVQAAEAHEVFDRAGKAFRDILARVEDVSRMVGQIAVAAEQQSAAIEQMSTNVEGIATVSREVAGQTGELARSSQSLAGEAHRLQEAVGRFRLG